MANKYGPQSRENMVGVLEDLRALMEDDVLPVVDHSVIDGSRTQAEQVKNIEKGVSKTMNSMHIPRTPDGKIDFSKGKARAVDVIPYPFAGWEPVERMLNAARNGYSAESIAKLAKQGKGIPPLDPTFQTFEFYKMLGVIQAMAHKRGLKVRLGADWDRDNELSEHAFIDLPHVEIPIDQTDD